MLQLPTNFFSCQRLLLLQLKKELFFTCRKNFLLHLLLIHLTAVAGKGIKAVATFIAPVKTQRIVFAVFFFFFFFLAIFFLSHLWWTTTGTEPLKGSNGIPTKILIIEGKQWYSYQNIANWRKQRYSYQNIGNWVEPMLFIPNYW